MRNCHPITGDALLTQRQAAEALGVGPYDVLDLADAGCLAWETTGGMRGYTRASVDAHAARMHVERPVVRIRGGRAALILGVSSSTVSAWARRGKLGWTLERGVRWYSETEVRALADLIEAAS